MILALWAHECQRDASVSDTISNFSWVLDSELCAKLLSDEDYCASSSGFLHCAGPLVSLPFSSVLCSLLEFFVLKASIIHLGNIILCRSFVFCPLKCPKTQDVINPWILLFSYCFHKYSSFICSC